MSAIGLLNDWCAAHQLRIDDIDDTLLRTFQQEVPLGATRTRETVQALRSAGAPISGPAPSTPARSTDRDPTEWLPVAEAIRRCPARGRDGIRGRRDALILACLGAGLTRAQVQTLTAGDAKRDPWAVGGIEMPYAQDPLVCSRCAIARWLPVLDDLISGTRAAAANRVMPAIAGHACEQAEAARPWSGTPLVPAIDQHGWCADTNLSIRSLTMVVGVRMRLDAPLPDDHDRQAPLSSRRHVDLEAENARLEELLGQLEGYLDDVEGHRPGVTSPDWQP